MEFEKQQVWNRISSESGNYENYYCQTDDTERQEFRNWVKGLMWSRQLLIEFSKADGSTRVMQCTLSDLYGAKYPEKNVLAENAQTEKKPNEHVCRVWDIEKGAWRSFRWDRLKRIEFGID